MRLKLRPGDRDAERDIALLRTFTQSQSVVRRRRSTIKQPLTEGIPVEINGRKGCYSMDTGALTSFISEAEALRLGLPIQASEAKIGNIAGHTTGLRTAVAKQLRIGEFVLRNVAFTVLPDGQAPFQSGPIDRRGVIGIPVILALGTVRATDRMVEFGFPASKNKELPNLAFDESQPITTATVLGQKLTFLLDTGAQETYLYQPFADALPSVVQRGTKVTKQVTGIGGSVQMESLQLPEVPIEMGAFGGRLRPARLLLKKTTRGSEFFAGNLGMDFLSQAHRMTLDLVAMKVSLQ